MPMFNWLGILLTDYNTEVFINCESRMMSNCSICARDVIINPFFNQKKCPVFNSYSKLWDYENVTKTSNSQNMSHVLKIQEAQRPLVQKRILILSYNWTNIQRKEVEYVIVNDFILASWSKYLYGGHGGTLKSAFSTDNMKLIYCIVLWLEKHV